MNWALTILSWFLSLFASREAAKNEGRAEAERQQGEKIVAAAAQAAKTSAAADKVHASDGADTAFDQEFRRP